MGWIPGGYCWCLHGPPTKAATAVAIRCTSSAERPAGGWAPVWSEAVELSLVLSGVSAVRGHGTRRSQNRGLEDGASGFFKIVVTV